MWVSIMQYFRYIDRRLQSNIKYPFLWKNDKIWKTRLLAFYSHKCFMIKPQVLQSVLKIVRDPLECRHYALSTKRELITHMLRLICQHAIRPSTSHQAKSTQHTIQEVILWSSPFLITLELRPHQHVPQWTWFAKVSSAYNLNSGKKSQIPWWNIWRCIVLTYLLTYCLIVYS